MAADGMTGDLHSVVERRLRRADQRYTPGRRAILDLLVSTGHPVSIGDIADRLPGLPRSSAYRHLTDLLVRLAFVGKGGSGKTTLSSLLVHHLAGAGPAGDRDRRRH